MANFCQDIKTKFLHLAGVLIEHFLKGISLLRYWYINPNHRSNKYKSSLYQSLNGALPSRKCSMKKAPKCKTSIRVTVINEVLVNDWAPS